MIELELTRSSEDRHVYLLDGVGSLRFAGFGSGNAVAEAGGASWQFARRGLWRTIEATDAAGTTIGSFASRALRGGGTLRWQGRDYLLRPVGFWRNRYELAEGELGLAVLDPKGWGKRPVKVLATDPDRIDAGLLLFATWVSHLLAGEASSAAGASTATMG